MEAAVPKQPAQPKPRSRKASVHRRKIDTIEKFREWRPRDGFKYEWNNGVIEKLPKMITFKNLYIVQRLNRFFQTTESYRRGDELFTEPESMTSPTQLRIPNMAYYTARQIKEGAEGKTLTMPEFIIEFVSNFDQHPKVLEKLEEYFSSGVRVAWLVIPQVKVVYVYTSPVEVTICKGRRICSAEPVIPGFKISAEALFS